MDKGNKILETVHNLMQQFVNSGAVWSCRTYISDNGVLPQVKSEVIDNLMGPWQVGLSLSVILIGIQCLKIQTEALKNNVSYGKLFLPYLLNKVTIILLFIAPPVYAYAVTYLFATPADLAAKATSMVYFDKFITNVDTLISIYTNSLKNPVGFIKATLNQSLTTTLFSALIYILAIISLLVVSLIQSIVFLVLFYLGPFCMVFMLCDWFSDIAERWIRITLGMAWLGFIGSVCLMVSATTPILESLSIGAIASNIIVIPVFGIVCLILFWLAYPITMYLFGGGFAFAGMLNINTGKNILKTSGKLGTAVTGTAGKAMAHSGKLISTFAKTGSALDKIGNVINKGGNVVSNTSKTINVALGPTVPGKNNKKKA